MNQETPKINIAPKAEKVFRDKPDKRENPVFKFSAELENNDVNDRASKKLEVLNAETNERVGAIYFNQVDDALEIKEVIIGDRYRGNEVGVSLYEELIVLAKSKKLGGIKSDCVVQGGAIAIWKKLEDRGYKVKIHPSAKEKYEEFKKIYEEGKYFKKLLTVPTDDSVFELTDL